MSKHVPAGPQAPVIYYVQPSPPTAPADRAAHRRDQQNRHDRWLKRHETLRRRDRTVRRVLLVIAIVIGVGLLTAGVTVGCTAYRTVTHLGDRAWPGARTSLLPTGGWSGTAVDLMPGSAALSGVGR